MRVLVACEYSGTVRDAFAALGHLAISCDFKASVTPTMGRLHAGPSAHYQGDVRDILLGIDGRPFDLLIAHPPCTYLATCAAWAFGDGPYHQKVKPETLVGQARREAREEAIAFFRLFWECSIPRIAIENPVGCISSRVCRPSQIIQPHQFGDDASKTTCLWLRGLPKLTPTRHVAPRVVNGKPRWANQTNSGQNRLSPSASRAALRAVTYPGIAAAMAAQWGAL